MSTSQERALESEEAGHALRLAVEAARMGLWSWNARTNVVIWDDATCAIFGLPLGGGPTSYETYRLMIHPGDRALVEDTIGEALRTGVYRDVEHRVTWPDGSIHWVLAKGTIFREADGTPRKILGGVIDITERKQIEEQRRQAQKMEAVGQLTSGIAHNFNNLLNVILPNVESLRPLVTPAAKEILDDIEASGQRATELIRNLMAFTRVRGERLPKRVSLRSIVEGAVDMSRRSLGPDTIVAIAGAGAASVRVDAASIEQALLNILLNARDALEGRPSPRVWIAIDDVGGGEDSASLARGATGEEERFAQVVIRDNGIGIDEATRQRVFEPFFTTKPVGRGTGLGLATAYAIVREHGGSIECTSRAGEGAAFTIRLPVDVLPIVPSPALSPEPTVSTPGLRERILCVDDEPMVRRAIVRILKAAGYQVSEAAGGEEALVAYDRPGAFDLILLDVAMPGCSGLVVRERVMERDPAARVVFVTGDASTAIVPGAAVTVIEKPIMREALLGTIRRVIEER